MAFSRVYSTAFFVLLCTNICISNGYTKGKRGCRRGNQTFRHGQWRAEPLYCHVYECDDSIWRYVRTGCIWNKKCYWKTSVEEVNGVKWRCVPSVCRYKWEQLI
ncbi:hypothetical protein PoB_004464700 [Plakobranchus ocellatus]|uniref:Uncharacterized protein n=1 Tax=Plakobranchus ocellatus TaxID=259542 RepID=A0AAV4BFE0_9GAST|nr:hypothetical protein PoB_004464700 [Plakobranchus ocellatus]